MSNGFYMARSQPVDYSGIAQAGGAPLGGLMGGVQQGMQMAQQARQMQMAEQQFQAKQQAAQTAAAKQQQIDALAMQAMQGDPEAMDALTAVSPETAMQMQQVAGAQQEQQIKQEEAEREYTGALGSMMVSSKKSDVRATYERAVNRIRNPGVVGGVQQEGDDERDVGLPSREEAAKMTDDELYSVMQNVGGELEIAGMGPEAAAQMRMKEREQEIKQAVAKGKLEAVVPAIEDPTKGRKEFTNLSKTFITQRDAYGRIKASAEEPSAAGDLALIFNYMKLLDPGSVVREGEFATAQSAAGIPDRIRNTYNRVLTGERLGNEQRGDFVNRSEKLFDRATKSHKELEGQFGKLAEKSNIAKEDVVIDFLGEYRKRDEKKKKTPAEKAKERSAEKKKEEPADLAKIVIETRNLPDGRVMVRYSDGTVGMQ